MAATPAHAARERASTLVVKIADSADEVRDVHRLNHEVFAGEVAQHAATPDGLLVDAHHPRNTYFIAKRGTELVGMMCLTAPDGSFSVEKRLPDPSVIDRYRPEAIEIRLLAVRKDARHGLVTAALARAVADYAIGRGYRYALISGITSQVPLYRRFGFEALGEAVPDGAASFVPMVLTLERFLAFARQLPALGEVRWAAPSSGRPVLLTPGPVAVHPSVLAAVGEAEGLHHRSDAFAGLMGEIETRLREVFGVPADFAFAALGASGSGMVEAMLRLAARQGRPKLLVVANGHFGDRLAEIADGAGLAHVVLRQPPGSDVGADGVARALEADPAIGAVAVVHHETSVGHVNEMDGVRAACDRHGTVLAVDMISSLGGEPFDFGALRPDLAVTVSGKALGGLPGIGLALVRDRVVSGARSAPTAPYLDLPRYVSAWHGRSVPWTPPVPLFPPLRCALERIAREGLAAKIDRHARGLAALVNAIEEGGFARVPVSHPSCTTATFTYRSAGRERFDRFERALRRCGYACYENAAYHRPVDQFQVSTMGCLEVAEAEALAARLRRMGW
jgi:aspartate aminotransferase-like enzyme